MSKDVTIVCISDTHELHRKLDVPDGELLIHAGDFTMSSKSMGAVRDFNDWLGTLPHRCKILIPGNHEFFLEADPAKRALLYNAVVLINEGTEVLGLKIWGSPTTPLYGGAFGLSSSSDRRLLYSRIPDDIDLLITHGPPLGVLDQAPNMISGAGCPELKAAVERIRPRLHVFGHVHRVFSYSSPRGGERASITRMRIAG